jgi:hypothetical protein
MKCFEVVQRVLDETYSQIPGNQAERDAAIVRALKAISDQYTTKLLTSGGPNFEEAIARFAYVFLYVPSHAHWLNELMTKSPQIGELFSRPKLRITCLGGGPGSDLVGALKYMADHGMAPALFCEIVDGCIQWKQTWADLAYTLNWESPVHTDYVIHDVALRSTWSAPTNFAKADIFTISFFASEIFHLGTAATEYLEFAIGQAKPGALVLVNDNNDSRFFEWLDKIMAFLGFETIFADEGQRKIFDRGEKLSALKLYQDKFKISSKLTGQLFRRVYRRSVQW